MSKAQELIKQRESLEIISEKRTQSQIENAESMDSFYNNILTEEDVENALNKYGENFETIQRKFIEKTRIQGDDIGFLLFGVLLLVAKTIVLNWLTKPERANSKGGREDSLHNMQEKVLGKFSKGETSAINNLYVSLEAIITIRGVPYDATRYKWESLGLFKGANHRFSTLGHDPALGMIFGTANILTSTLTTTRFETYHVTYDEVLKNPKIDNRVSTLHMLSAAEKRFDGDIESVVAAVIKQMMHIATDLYTPCGIQLPGIGLVLDNKSVEELTRYISTGDLIKAGASAGSSAIINTIISAVHGSELIYSRNDKDESEYSWDLYQARTRKVVMYSNIIASSSNIIATIISEEVKLLDIGGIAVMLYRLFSDSKFICKLEYEFINSGLSDIYSERYETVKDLYE